MSRSKVRAIVLSLSGLSLALVLPVALRDAEAQGTPRAAAPQTGRVARGKYLVILGGCNDCHTPWKMGANGFPSRT